MKANSKNLPAQHSAFAFQSQLFIVVAPLVFGEALP
jgi:hypothetical protein